MRKHFDICISICEEAGLKVSEITRRKKHIKVICEEGFVFMPSTPSDRRWQKNALRVAKRIARQN
tara:strand:- start:348 stop:542 length:195 start_codon:yes stop_codon:yes gene_type:complete